MSRFLVPAVTPALVPITARSALGAIRRIAAVLGLAKVLLWQALSTASASELELTDQFWIVLASKQTASEAIDVARQTDGALVLSSSNGWYAVVLGPVSYRSMSEARRENPERDFASDAYLSRGTRFTEKLWPRESAPQVADVATKEPEPAPNDQLTISFQSMNSYRVDLKFFSQSRSVSWPGEDQVYSLSDSQEHQYVLRCNPGEKICWGAAVRRGPGQGYGDYYGAGIDGQSGCDHCCLSCGNVYGVRQLNN